MMCKGTMCECHPLHILSPIPTLPVSNTWLFAILSFVEPAARPVEVGLKIPCQKHCLDTVLGPAQLLPTESMRLSRHSFFGTQV